MIETGNAPIANGAMLRAEWLPYETGAAEPVRVEAFMFGQFHNCLVIEKSDENR